MSEQTQNLIVKQLDDINEILKKNNQILNNLYMLFSKYDNSYLEEMEKEGISKSP